MCLINVVFPTPKLPFNNIKSPILIMHGKADNIVPFYMGKKLFVEANEPKMFYFPEEDNHMMEYNEKLIKTLSILALFH